MVRVVPYILRTYKNFVKKKKKRIYGQEEGIYPPPLGNATDCVNVFSTVGYVVCTQLAYGFHPSREHEYNICTVLNP